MENKERYSEFARKVIEGVVIAHQKMIREKTIRGEKIVIAEENGRSTTVSAKKFTKND